ncbi:hypothetical protein L1987_83317 [Smallanthus sonchifolius]|uniref:Uncharacterized protein n=1 Tax=Smallanthus sonchifolius TaxID=185202 RepID=A0ACB8YCJ8_9ASTR|nr:hypothetical protein L1987_83317 [Smallanthus sonchifolius]
MFTGVVNTIRRKLSQNQMKIWKRTCFSRWLGCKCTGADNLLIHVMFQHEFVTKLNPRTDGLYYFIGSETLRLVALKPNEEEIKLEWWISSLEYISKQQNVEDRHTLHRNGIAVSEPTSMSDNIPKVGEKLDKLLELGLKDEGKVDRLLELVQQVVSNIEEEGYRKRKFVVEGEEEEEIDTEFVKNILDEDYATAYGTLGPSVEAK